MRLKTIWSLPAMQLKERFARTYDLGVMTLAAKLPLRLRFWVAMGEISKATSNLPGNTEVPGIPLSTLLKNLDTPRNLS